MYKQLLEANCGNFLASCGKDFLTTYFSKFSRVNCKNTAPSLLAVACVFLLPSNFLRIHYFLALLYMYVREN